MHHKQIVHAGKPLAEADKAVIMLHGRGAPAEDILSLSAYLDIRDYALLAPQANGNSWYPLSFLTLPQQNEPWLSSALALIQEIVEDLVGKGFTRKSIYFVGFSQGACLTLEFACRHAAGYGGIVAFTGGLIGDQVYTANYGGDFQRTPVFIGTSDPDPHIPVERVYATEKMLSTLNASVSLKVYPGMGHTIIQEEIDAANQFVFDAKASVNV